MWLVLGLVLIALVAWGVYHWRLNGRWRRIRWAPNGLSYEVMSVHYHGLFVRLDLGIDCATGMRFCLRRERQIDRFFKWIGLSREYQLGQQRFDDRIYVLSEDRRLITVLQGNLEIVDSLADLFGGTNWHGYCVKKIRCESQQIWVEIANAKFRKTTSSVSVERDVTEAAISRVLPTLRKLSSVLCNQADADEPSSNRLLKQSCLLAAIGWALAVHGVLQFPRIKMSQFPVVLEQDALTFASIVLGCFLLVALLGATLVMLGRTSRAHGLLIEILAVGGIGAFTSGFALLHEANISFDFATPKLESALVNRHDSVRCGKHGRDKCYLVGLAPNASMQNGVTLWVNAWHYGRLRPGKDVAVLVHPGAFGFAWIEAPQPIPVVRQ